MRGVFVGQSLRDKRTFVITRCALAALALSVAASPTNAQSSENGLLDLVPRFDTTDQNNVDVVGATYRLSENLVAGDKGPALSLSIASPNLVGSSPQTLGMLIYFGLTSNAAFTQTGWYEFASAVRLPNQAPKFDSSPPRVTVQPDGSWLYTPLDAKKPTKLIENAARTQFSFSGSDGTTALLESATLGGPLAFFGDIYPIAVATSVTFPSGEIWSYNNNSASYLASGVGTINIRRVKTIVSSRGYVLQFDYESDASNNLANLAARESWYSIVKVTRYNKAQYTCNEPALTSCAAVFNHPDKVTLAYDRTSGGKVTITKPNGEVVRLLFSNNLFANPVIALSKIERGTDPSATIDIQYLQNVDQDTGSETRWLSSITQDGRTWSYSTNSVGPYEYQTSVFRPDQGVAQFRYSSSGLVYQKIDPASRMTQYNFAVATTGAPNYYAAIPSGQIEPEGNDVTASFDPRGNAIEVRWKAKVGSGLTDRTVTATFPATCTDATLKVCNKPLMLVDERGNQTDYTYDAAHGGALTESGPAINGVRPQKRFLYTARFPRWKNSAGTVVNAPTPIYVLTEEQHCKSTAASGNGCAGGAADLVRTTYDYGPTTGAAATNNLLVRGQVVDDGGLALRICYTYDQAGRKISERQPASNQTTCP
jgi:hypothetical protein